MGKLLDKATKKSPTTIPTEPKKPKDTKPKEKQPQSKTSKEVAQLRERLRKAERIVAKTDTFLIQLRKWERFTDPRYSRTETVNEIKELIDNYYKE